MVHFFKPPGGGSSKANKASKDKRSEKDSKAGKDSRAGKDSKKPWQGGKHSSDQAHGSATGAVNPTRQRMITIDVEQFNHDGQGIGYVEDKIVFVEGALPGEQVQALVLEDKARFIKARVVEVTKASPTRVTPSCVHFAECGGCQLQYTDSRQQLKLKQQGVAALFSRYAQLPTLPWQTAIVAEPWHYRRAARIGVWYDKKTAEFTVGFRRAGDKTLTAIRRCDVLVKPFADIFTGFSQLLPKLACGRSITHLEVISADNIDVVVVRHTQALSAADQLLLQQLGQLHHWLMISEAEKGVLREINGDLSQSHRAPLPRLYYDLPRLDLRLEFRLQDFIQVNSAVNQQMVDQALEWLDLSATDKVLDLFCGIGNFSLPIATRCSQVLGIEGVEDMVRQATHNSQQNQLDNCQFICADLAVDPKGQGQYAGISLRQFNKVLLDPARAGAELLMAQIIKAKVKKIVYVSCEPLTMARDSAILIKAGYKLTKIALMEMFAQTRRVEVMASFER